MKGLHTMIEPAETRCHSSAIALVTPDETYTYARLNYESDLLGAFLQRISSGNKHVAILLGNRAETVVSIFGVSKAGGTFINLNPS